MKGDKEAKQQVSKEEVKTILEDDGTKLALMMSRMRECQRIRTRVMRAENQQTYISTALIEQETIEENEL